MKGERKNKMSSDYVDVLQFMHCIMTFFFLFFFLLFNAGLIVTQKALCSYSCCCYCTAQWWKKFSLYLSLVIKLHNNKISHELHEEIFSRLFNFIVSHEYMKLLLLLLSDFKIILVNVVVLVVVVVVGE